MEKSSINRTDRKQEKEKTWVKVPMYKKYLHSEFQRAQHFCIYKFIHVHVSAAQSSRVAFELHLTTQKTKP